MRARGVKKNTLLIIISPCWVGRNNNRMTNLNLAVSLSLAAVFICKTILTLRGDIWSPTASLILHTCGCICTGLSVFRQLSPDFSDSDHPSPVPWYLVKECGAVDACHAISCVMAKGTFGVMIVLL